MKIFKSPRGRSLMTRKQNDWRDEDYWPVDDNLTTQVTHIAGEKMTVTHINDDFYELEYLGFISDSFKGIELAKSMAPEFARTVLLEMHKLIKD